MHETWWQSSNRIQNLNLFVHKIKAPRVRELEVTSFVQSNKLFTWMIWEPHKLSVFYGKKKKKNHLIESFNSSSLQRVTKFWPIHRGNLIPRIISLIQGLDLISK